MTTAGKLLAATAEYIEASRVLVADPASTAAAVRFFLGKRDLRALSRRTLGRNVELILARLISEAVTDDRVTARAERTFKDKWINLFGHG